VSGLRGDKPEGKTIWRANRWGESGPVFFFSLGKPIKAWTAAYGKEVPFYVVGKKKKRKRRRLTWRREKSPQGEGQSFGSC